MERAEREETSDDAASAVGTATEGGPHRSVKRTAEVVLLGLILGGLLVVGGNWVWREWAFVGREQQITLSWQCSNHIEWKDVDRDIRWRVPQGTRRPTPTSASAMSGGSSFVVAKGTIHFDSPDTATFRSDGGGETPMVRVSGDQFFEMSCVIG